MSFASSFTSALSAVGHGLKVFFTGAEKVAVAAEPFVDTIFPGAATLYNGIVAEVGQVEASAIAAGAQTGTGTQKLALVVASVEADFTAYEKANNITVPHTQDQITAAVNGVVAFLNALSATVPASVASAETPKPPVVPVAVGVAPIAAGIGQTA